MRSEDVWIPDKFMYRILAPPLTEVLCYSALNTVTRSIYATFLPGTATIIFEWQGFTCSSKGECSVMVGVSLLVNVDGRLKGPGWEGIQIVGQVGVWGVGAMATELCSWYVERYYGWISIFALATVHTTGWKAGTCNVLLRCTARAVHIHPYCAPASNTYYYKA